MGRGEIREKVHPPEKLEEDGGKAEEDVGDQEGGQHVGLPVRPIQNQQTSAESTNNSDDNIRSTRCFAKNPIQKSGNCR